MLCHQASVLVAFDADMVAVMDFEQAADREEETCGCIRSEGDLFLNDANPCLLSGDGVDQAFEVHEHHAAWTVEPASDSLREVLQVCTGWQSIPRPQERLAVVGFRCDQNIFDNYLL